MKSGKEQRPGDGMASPTCRVEGVSRSKYPQLQQIPVAGIAPKRDHRTAILAKLRRLELENLAADQQETVKHKPYWMQLQDAQQKRLRGRRGKVFIKK